MTVALTTESLQKILGREVEEIHLVIAKSLVLGMDTESIASSLGVEKGEVDELMETQEFKDIRLLVGAEYAKSRVERDNNWDGIEQTALENLSSRVKMERDTDTLLRIAAVANRAQRRTAPPKEGMALDPSQATHRVPLTLTRRYTEKLNTAGQTIERSETQQISVLNGSAVNPTFKEVSQLLRGDTQERLPQTQEAYVDATTDEPFSLDALKEMAERMKR